MLVWDMDDFIDDIDGGAAEGTVRFALDGTEYEIDLNAEHSGQTIRIPLDTNRITTNQGEPE